MGKVIITDACYRQIRAAATGGDFAAGTTGVRQPNGDWQIELGEEVQAHLARLAAPDESLSDTITRAMYIAQGGKPS